MRRTSLSLAVLLAVSTSPSWAQESTNAYYFGGACSSQGSWTQAALSSTQAIRKITEQLRDDPNCRALGVSMQAALTKIDGEVQSVADTPQRAARLSQIPQEIGALRSFISSSPEMKNQALKIMMSRSIEGATLSAQVPPSSTPTSSTETMAAGMTDFGQRLSRSTKTGLTTMNQVLDSIPKMDECLASPNSTGQLFAASVKVLASFASSGQDSIGSQLAASISKLSTVMRDRKYAKVLRTLNEQQYLSSMACLMEVTSESYCSARDGMMLFEKGMGDLQITQSKAGDFELDGTSNSERKANNPFTGYYILSKHVPNITQWLQKIQIGVDPKLTTDAVFQSKILDEVNTYVKTVKSLYGEYNSSLSTIQSLTSLEAKQNAVMNLLVRITDKMTPMDNGQTNFFTMNKVQLKIPFFLIGMEGQIPDNVTGKAMPFMGYQDWLQANLSTIPAFKDPTHLAEVIGTNMKLLIADANTSSIEYYNKWFVVDKSAIVNDSLTNATYTVKDSLIAVDAYLSLFIERVEKYHGDTAIIPTVLDTKHRIGIVLESYAKIDALSKKLVASKANKSVNERLLQESSEAYAELINEVYEQFSVMLARSGFIANRMVNFVYQDYVLMMRNKVDFSTYQQELFYATGQSALDRMLQLFNGNPANVKTDLSMALRINKANLEAVELLLKDSLVTNIAHLQLIAKKGNTTAADIALNSVDRATREALRTNTDPIRKKTLWQEASDRVDRVLDLSLPGLMTIIPSKILAQLVGNEEKYPMKYVGSSDMSGPQSEFNDVTELVGQLCVQALAFNDVKTINSVCAGTKLESPFPLPSKMDAAAKKRFQDYLAVNFNTKLRNNLNLEKNAVNSAEKISLNHSERICAFRDYNRRNLVLYLTLGIHRN